MRIEVAIEEWQQACCGEPFAVGDRVTWTVSAADPAERATGALPRYNEDHHGQIPEEVPSAEITGHVVAISGVTYAREEIGAQADYQRLDVTRPTMFPLTSVGRGSESPIDTYLSTLEIADDIALPDYVLGTAEAERRSQERRTARLNRARLDDEIGRMLTLIADETEARYSALADISRPADRGGCRILPLRDDATAIRWARSDVAEQDGIAVTTGDGSWFLEATSEGVAELREFVAAAANGRVRESVDRGEDDGYLLVTEVVASNRTWTSTTDYAGPATRGDVIMVVKHMWDRVQRGDHTYAPWGDEPPRH